MYLRRPLLGGLPFVSLARTYFGEGIDIYLMGRICDSELVIRTAATVSLEISNFFITGSAIF